MPAGRPTLYNDKMRKIAFNLALLGATDEQIADTLNIAVSTLNLWKNEHPEFMEAIRSGKTEADAKVAAGLYKRAIGFKFEETTIENTMLTTVSQAGNVEMTPGVLVKRVKKMVPPDVTAQKFWLTNRQPGEWKEKTESKVTTTNFNIEPSPEEAAKIKEALDKSI